MTLSVDGANLTEIANAIREKGGTNQPLEFPDGFAAALEDIETEVTIQPKIEPRQVVLTPDVTAFPINAGFHDGTGTVSIDTVEGSASPTNQQVTYQPPAGKFFSRFWVDGIGNATQIITGSVVLNNERDLTVGGLSFTPIGILVIHIPDPNVKRYDNQVLNAISVPGLNPSTTGTSQNSGAYVNTPLSFSFSSGTATVSSTSYARFIGTYFYIVFG